MSVTDKSVFTPVTSRGDLQRIFNSCVESGKPLMGQSELGGRFSFRATFLTGLKLRGEIKSSQTLSIIENVTLLISVNEERYLARTRFESIDGADAIISLDCAVFKLQRRDNFRVSVYQMQNARIEIESINGKRSIFPLKLIDISAGGLGAEMGLEIKVPINMKDVITGRVVIPGFLNELLEGDIRYIKARGSAGSGIKHIGIQFKNLTAAVERELNVRVLEIHREYFSKLEFARAK